MDNSNGSSIPVEFFEKKFISESKTNSLVPVLSKTSKIWRPLRIKNVGGEKNSKRKLFKSRGGGPLNTLVP